MQTFYNKNLSVKGFTKRIKFFVFLLSATLLSGTAVANVYVPNTFTDPVFTSVNTATGAIILPAGNAGLISLRSSLFAADFLGGTHTVTLSTGTYNLSWAPKSQIVIGNTAQNITINGNGPANTIINMVNDANRDRILFINPTGATNSPVITVSGITFQNGYLTSDFFGGAALCSGGGSAESLTVTNCAFLNNTLPANAYGGAAINVQVRGNLTVDNCTFTNNVSNDADGGAILFIIFNSTLGTGYGTLNVTNSTFTGNSVVFPGAPGSNGGALAFTGQGGVTPFNATITKNTFLNNTADGYGGAIMANNSPNVSIPQIHYNRFVGNVSSTDASTNGMLFVNSAGSVNAENNWWGCNTGPTAAGACDRAGGIGASGGGVFDADPWLQLKTTASPNPICNTPAGLGNTSLVTTSFLTNSSGGAIALSDLTRLIGLPVLWSTGAAPVLGTLSAQQVTIQANGTATATFTANTTGGNATVNTQVDNVPITDPTARATIVVNTIPVVTADPSNFTSCVGGTATFTSTITGTPTPTFQWRIGTTVLVNGLQASGSTVSGATTTTLTITNVQPGDEAVNYNVRATNHCGEDISTNATLFVNSVTGGTVGSDQTICSGGDPAAFTQSVASTGSGALTYQWQSSTTLGCSAGFSNIGGATGTTYDPPAGLAVTTLYRRVTTSTLNTVPCTAFSNCITVTINNVTGGTVAAAQTVCSGGDPALLTQTVASTGSGVLSYQWQSSTTDCSSSFSDIVGATATTYDPPAGLLVTTFYRRVTTSLLTAVPCTANSNCITVTVNGVTGGSIATDQTICSGGDPALLTQSVASTGSGALTYQWQSSTTGCGGAFSNIGGATATTYDPPAGLLVTTYYRRVTTSTLTGVPCTANSNCITVTINNVTGGTVGSDETICSGGDPALFTESVASTGDGVLSYQWQSSTTGCGGAFSNIGGATSATYDAPAGVLVTTNYRRVTTSTLNEVPCTANSNCITVTVRIVGGGTVAASQTFCAGGDPLAFTESVASTGDEVLSYQWQSSTTDCSTDFTNIDGATATTYDPPAGLTTTTYYRRVTTSTFNGLACTANSNCLTVTITTVSTAPTGATGTTTICSGSSTILTVTGGSKATGAVTEWFTGSCEGTLVFTGDAYTTPVLTANATYYVRYNGLCNATTCAEVTVTVIQPANAGSDGNTSVCDNSTTPIDLFSLITGEQAGGTWSRTGGTGGTFVAATGTFTPAAGAITSTFQYLITGTSPCPNDASVATVNITALPVITCPYTNFSVCFNSPPIDLSEEDGIFGSSFSGTGVSGNVFYPATAGVGPHTITYSLTNGVCTSTCTFIITVSSLSTAPTGATGTTTICNGGSTTLTVTGGSKGTGAITEWFTGSCGSTPAGTGDAVTVSPTTTTTYYVRYNGTCNTTGCATVTVIVNTLSTAPTGATGTTTICNGGSTTLTVTGGSKGTGAITEWFTGSCGGASAGTGDAITVSPTTTTTYYIRYNGTCNTTTCATVIVTVNTAPVVTTNPLTQSVVPSNTAIFTAAASGSPTPTVQWQVSTDGGGTFTDISGETSTTLSFATTAGQNGYQYRAVFTNTCGTATTTAATLTTCTTPVVTTNPISQAICAGNTVNFSAAATGTPTPTVKWQVSSGGPFTDIAGETSTTLSFTATIGQNGNQYRAVFTNACAPGGVNTTAATLTVNTTPTITCPANISVNNTTGRCDAVVTYISSSTGTPAPTITYVFTGATTGSGSGNGSGSTFNVGVTTVTLTATNICGAPTCSFTVTVVDNQPPVITGVTATPYTLWPPNHKMRDVTVTIISTDNCSGNNSTCTITSVSSNEPINGTGDGDTAPDWIIGNDGHSLQLRAERAGNGNGRVYTITVTCTDASGNSSTASTTVIVAHNITAPVSGNSFKVGSTVSFSGTFWDKPGNKHTGKWLIDGSALANATITEPVGNQNGKSTGSYKFNSPGVYKLQMNITDQNGITSYANTQGDLEAIVVIYDPNGGHTYGGGYYNSPAGALTSNPTVTGKASYGFAMNYFKNSTNPKGETQFDFRVGDFEYNALNFDYLVINNSMSQFRGTGKIIGGQSGINFIMTVIDGQLDGTGVDKVRMKIFNKNTGRIYYDNMLGASDAALPVQAVGTNSTVVIQGINNNNLTTKLSTEVVPETTPTESLQVAAYPNPTSSNYTVQVNAGNTKDRILLQVFDVSGRIVETRNNVTAGSTFKLGDKYRPGSYFIRVMQGKEHKEMKLIKLSD